MKVFKNEKTNGQVATGVIGHPRAVSGLNFKDALKSLFAESTSVLKAISEQGTFKIRGITYDFAKDSTTALMAASYALSDNSVRLTGVTNAVSADSSRSSFFDKLVSG